MDADEGGERPRAEVNGPSDADDALDTDLDEARKSDEGFPGAAIPVGTMDPMDEVGEETDESDVDGAETSGYGDADGRERETDEKAWASEAWTDNEEGPGGVEEGPYSAVTESEDDTEHVKGTGVEREGGE